MQNYLREGVDKVANSRGRDLGHVGRGLLLVGGALVVTLALSRFAVHEAEEEEEERSSDEEPRQLSAVWTPLFLALTISGFRVWNAPRSRARDGALLLWSIVQVLNTALMALGPKRFSGQTGATLAATASALAYAKTAQRVDPGAASLVSPFVGWGSIASLVSDTVRSMPKRKTYPVGVTVH
jgi:tryptophan-rich sensory protein